MDSLSLNLSQIIKDWQQGKHIEYWRDELFKFSSQINAYVVSLLRGPILPCNLPSSIENNVRNILIISNILYNNTNASALLLEDGIYDRLVTFYHYYTGKDVVGAMPVRFKDTVEKKSETVMIKGMEYLNSDSDNKFFENSLFFEDLYHNAPFSPEVSLTPGMTYDSTVTKRIRNTAHANPELVGTLDKCKFCLVSQARNADPKLLDDPTVKIVERDFFAKHIEEGLINPNEIIDVCLELKYDGVSIEATIFNDKIVRAGTRGDTEADLASDLTPILKGYRMPRALPLNKEINVKFEAIMTYYNLQKYSEAKGRDFINGRTAIISWIGSSDAYKYRELITLVPLATDLVDENGQHIDRLVEIEFMNKFLTRTELLRYSVISGNFESVLYQVYKYSKEAEYMRKLIPFMYDGIVISYLDPRIRQTLGRKSFINKYTIALKFEPLVRRTRFDHYTFEVGQNGVITPRIWYDPVEFFGSIHPKSSGHSYGRFKTLSLRKGDLIDVTYRNDVMPYVTKADCTENDNNPNPIIEFPKYCPECNTELKFTDSSARCPNPKCKAVMRKKLTNMMAKLQFNGFAEETISQLNINSFHELMQLKLQDVEFLGPLTAQSLITQIEELKVKGLPDYVLVGALGFTNCAAAVWKKIFSVITLHQLIKLADLSYIDGVDDIWHILVDIPSIGEKIAQTICYEIPDYVADLMYIRDHVRYKITYGSKSIKMRFTGFRDKDLTSRLTEAGVDMSEGSVTKDTTFLVVPYEGYNTGKKYKDANKYGVSIITRNDLEEHFSDYTN